MAKTLILILILGFALVQAQDSNAVAFFPVIDNGKGGYIDAAGKLVIAPRFDEVKEFSEGLAAVRNGEYWGYIDTSGKFVIPPKFSNATDFSDGLALISENRKFGYIDKTGSFVISPAFDKADSFSEGFARVRLNGKWRFIGKDGKQAFETDFDYLDNFSNGVAVVAKIIENKSLRVSYIDKSGRLAPTGWVNYAGRFSDNLAVTSKDDDIVSFIDNRYGLIFDNADYKANRLLDVDYDILDLSGRKIFGITLQSLNDFHDGLALGCRNGKCGYIDNKGNVAIDFRFDAAEDFSEGLAHVKIGDENFVIDKTGKQVFKVNTTLIKPFNHGIGKMINCSGKSCRVSYVDATGKIIWQGTNGK